MIDSPYAIGSDTHPGLAKLVEELGELQQVIGKIMGAYGQREYFDGSDLQQKLHDELADVMGAIAFYIEYNCSEEVFSAITARAEVKYDRFVAWRAQHRLQN